MIIRIYVITVFLLVYGFCLAQGENYTIYHGSMIKNYATQKKDKKSMEYFLDPNWSNVFIYLLNNKEHVGHVAKIDIANNCIDVNISDNEYTIPNKFLDSIIIIKTHEGNEKLTTLHNSSLYKIEADDVLLELVVEGKAKLFRSYNTTVRKGNYNKVTMTGRKEDRIDIKTQYYLYLPLKGMINIPAKSKDFKRFLKDNVNNSVELKSLKLDSDNLDDLILLTNFINNN